MIVHGDIKTHVQTDTKVFVLAKTEMSNQIDTEAFVQVNTDCGFLGGPFVI